MKMCPLLLMLSAVLLILASGCASAASPRIVNVSAAHSHTVVLADDGSVWTWGQANNPWGILGTGGDQSDGSLHRVAGLSDVVAVDAKFLTSLALDKDGHVWAWGDNRYGQCGQDNAVASFSSPVQVQGLERIVQISCGGSNCAAVDADGHVWTWGDNFYGQLGTGSASTPRYRPAQAPIDSVAMVSAGNGYTVALKKDGTVWAWGENDHGSAGGPTTANVLSPSKVNGLSSIVKIEAGYDHTLALRDDGTVWAWGDGRENMLCNGQGYNDAPAVPVPVQVGGLPRVIDVSAGFDGSLVLGNDGNLYAWGGNGDGQYGNGIDLWTPAPTPQKVPGLGDVVTLSMHYGHCVAIKKDGSVWAWGRNLEDQIQAGLGKKVLSPMKKVDGGTALPSQGGQPQQSQSTPRATEPGADIAGYITIAGVIILAIALIGLVVLLKMRK